jgi:mono/diheme cytochrome c family protein
MTRNEQDFCVKVLKEKNMKALKFSMAAIGVVFMLLTASSLRAADDGASVYKAKCAACHGADAAGKPAAKIPSLVSDDAKKMSDDDLAKAVAEKAKHPAGVKSLPPDQIKMIVSYIRSLQK